MEKRVSSISLIICILVLIACVPQSVQLKGTWEFIGYKAERVESIIELDSTICFDGDGNGFFYPRLTISLSRWRAVIMPLTYNGEKKRVFERKTEDILF